MNLVEIRSIPGRTVPTAKAHGLVMALAGHTGVRRFGRLPNLLVRNPVHEDRCRSR